jgi:hypothetical protein
MRFEYIYVPLEPLISMPNEFGSQKDYLWYQSFLNDFAPDSASGANDKIVLIIDSLLSRSRLIQCLPVALYPDR